MATIRSGLVVIAVLLLSGYAAMAQSGNPCAGDIKTLCSGIQPGDARIKACIKSHLGALSPTCGDRLLTVAVTDKVCKGDIAKFCAGVVAGTGGLRTCIKSHIAEVSDGCQDAMAGTAAGKKVLGGYR
jgi:hypothetical protein